MMIDYDDSDAKSANIVVQHELESVEGDEEMIEEGGERIREHKEDASAFGAWDINPSFFDWRSAYTVFITCGWCHPHHDNVSSLLRVFETAVLPHTYY
jgi:hypothetical protein